MKTESGSTWIGELRPGEVIVIGNGIRLRVEEKSGQRARLRFDFREPTQVSKVTPGAAALAMQGIKTT